MEYTTVLTDDEVKFLRKLVHHASLTIPPHEFSDWVAKELPQDRVMEFYYTFMYPENKQ